MTFLDTIYNDRTNEQQDDRMAGTEKGEGGDVPEFIVLKSGWDKDVETF